MTIFKNLVDNRLYKMYKVTPRAYTGGWLEIEDLITGTIKKVPTYLEKKLVPVAHC